MYAASLSSRAVREAGFKGCDEVSSALEKGVVNALSQQVAGIEAVANAQVPGGRVVAWVSQWGAQP
jgi:hypothetical protein